MSEDREDQTEAASERRLQQAYEEGQVPVGRDLASVSGLAAAAVALSVIGPRLTSSLVALVQRALNGLRSPSPSDLGGDIVQPIGLVIAVCASAALASTIATLAQTRGGFWPELAAPDASRLFNASKLTRLFKLEGLADLGLALLKVGVIGTAAYSALHDDFMTLPKLLSVPLAGILPALLGPTVHAAVKVVTAMLILAGVDLAVSRYRFAGKMKMTREEAKRERREDEGDPLIRGRRRRKHRELAKANARAEVPKADVLVVNPTHIAIAIRYRRGQDKSPRVLAKGKGQLAEIMRELARENGIPIVQEIPLARLLYKRVKVGREIPAETFRAVAAVLAFVYRITGRNGARAA